MDKNQLIKLDRELANASINQLLDLFEREEKRYGAACVDYVERLATYSPAQQEEKELELEALYRAKARVAIVLAEAALRRERVNNSRKIEVFG